MSDGVKVNNLPAFDAKVMAWFAAVEKATAEAAVGVAKQVFENILINSPQFSGDFVANWRPSVGAPDPRFQVDVISGAARYRGHTDEMGIQPFGRGDTPAIHYAQSHAAWQLPKLGQAIYISNSVRHDEPYAWLIEDNKINFRPVNMGADRVARNAIERVGRRTGTIDKTKLAFLRSLGV